MRYGCGKPITVGVVRGWRYVEVKTKCGATAHDGGIDQCEKCEKTITAPPAPHDDEGDLEYDHRIHGLDQFDY